MKVKWIVPGLAFAFSCLSSLAQDPKFGVLVYTSPDVYHNPVIPTAITEFKKMAELHFFDVTWTQIEGTFNDETLKKYSVIVFLNSNGSLLNADQMASFKKFIKKGGGFVGIHAASVCKDREEWYQKLVGRAFTGHPEKQTAVMTVQNKSFPATMHLPDKWVWTDEWYEFEGPLTDGQNVLLTVDEKTYKIKTGMGAFHPISWYQEYDGGRSFFTALGHMEMHFTDPWFLKHLYGGIYWAATGKGIVK